MENSYKELMFKISIKRMYLGCLVKQVARQEKAEIIRRG